MTSRHNTNRGFTLMEILVATTIFAGVLTVMLVLFNYTLRINRRVESVRQVSQGTRNFIEYLVREIRNGQIDYASTDANCAVANYSSVTNQSLALINRNGEKICFYISGTNVYVRKGGVAELLNPPRFSVDNATFRIHVRPKTDPRTAPYPEVQPFVTLVGRFDVQLGPSDPIISIPYQTTVSSDVYDIPRS